ncbi:hypothetical protein FNQ90_14205 [Streptomyces alkaliphilus]|uniref:Uncharacterized protein n=1 Tax=Streptomyces alkaliphilus TaxID=1472722 RepID=A0A7W3TEK3_9ACTN|nr:hypothetical protein [Streptomyces alkaliphilus]
MTPPPLADGLGDIDGQDVVLLPLAQAFVQDLPHGPDHPGRWKVPLLAVGGPSALPGRGGGQLDVRRIPTYHPGPPRVLLGAREGCPAVGRFRFPPGLSRPVGQGARNASLATVGTAG